MACSFADRHVVNDQELSTAVLAFHSARQQLVPERSPWMWRVLFAVWAGKQLVTTVSDHHAEAFEMDRFTVPVPAFTIPRLLTDHTFDGLQFDLRLALRFAFGHGSILPMNSCLSSTIQTHFDISAAYFANKSVTKSLVAAAAFPRLISMSFFFAGTKSDLGSDITYCNKLQSFSRSSRDSLSSW